jgi:hypothetical protein
MPDLIIIGQFGGKSYIIPILKLKLLKFGFLEKYFLMQNAIFR